MAKENKPKKKEMTETQKKEIAFGVKLRLANKKNDYIKNLINGRYYLERSNSIAEQLIEGGKIEEKMDGRFKTSGYMRSEYALMKYQAITSMRNAHFAKEDLMNTFNQTEEEIQAIQEDYYDGKIIREAYDEEYKRKNKAEFISSSQD